jgi:hypothetical protein
MYHRRRSKLLHCFKRYILQISYAHCTSSDIPLGGDSAVPTLVVSPVTCAAILGVPVACGVLDHTHFGEGECLLWHTY